MRDTLDFLSPSCKDQKFLQLQWSVLLKGTLAGQELLTKDIQIPSKAAYLLWNPGEYGVNEHKKPARQFSNIM